MGPTAGRIADVMVEPADGAVLVTVDRHGRREVIWRDDAEARSWEPTYLEERWFDDNESDPLAWDQVTKYAVAVHEVAAEPTATAEVRSHG